MHISVIKNISIVALAVVIFTGCSVEDYVSFQEGREVVNVTHVIDGDTVVIDTGEKIRLLGIDTPERKAFYYEEATEALRELLKDQVVYAVSDISETDRYGRLLRHLHVGEVWINAEMIHAGHARMVTFPPDVAHVAEFRALQSEAREAQRGLWQER